MTTPTETPRAYAPLDYSAAAQVGQLIQTADTLKPSQDVQRLEVDAVIVGAGPGGLVTASVLAEAGLRVIVVEGGRFWPRGTFKRKQSWALEHLFQDRGQRVMTGNAIISLQSGRGVGGGTLVNSGISFRAPDRVLDEWVREHGVGFWEGDSRAALYAEVEATIGAAATRVSVAGVNSLIARRGFEALGVESAFMPRNTPGCVGCGTCQTGCPSGGKASADLNWLPRALRHGARLYADTRVESLLMQGQRVTGARALMRHPETGEALGRFEIKADRVILACGAINTATFLQKHRLASSSGMVGKNLHAHPGVGCLGLFREDVQVWSGATQGYYAHHPDDPEILAETFSVSPDILVAQAGGVGLDAMQFLREMRRMAACGMLIRDHSSGTVRHVEGKPPAISYHVLDADRRKFTRGLQFIARMFFAAGAVSVRPMLGRATFMDSLPQAHDFIESVTDPMDMPLYASHPMGTCRIGADPATSVARATDGRTHDHEGLYITDSSLLPTALGVNPQMTIMAQSLALARAMVRAG